VEIGIVTSVEINHKNVDTARKGQEVCLKIEPIPGDAPKMFGRHFDETDMLVSKVSVQCTYFILHSCVNIYKNYMHFGV
jgi:translation initiation factor 5B